ncbi:beta-L-arabinofuranosidase domain-containing protein [Wenyingzhuangia sp. IMCC45467]
MIKFSIKHTVLVVCMLLATGKVIGQKLKSFPLTAVRLLDSPFKEAEQTDIHYLLAIDPDRLLAPYLREAGLQPKKESYGNWENTGLDGHIGGHYITALSLMYASTGNQEILDRLNYMVDELNACQKKTGNGYVGGIPGGLNMWNEIAKGSIKAGLFSLNNKWVPIYNIHKTFAGLRDAWLIAGNETAKKMFIDLVDWFVGVTSNLSDAQIQEILISEHGGINEVFADAYDITGNEKYLTLAKRLSDESILNPLLKQENKLVGKHANTQIPKVIGYERIAELSGEQDWEKASNFFWNTVVDEWTVSIGGNSVREHFHDPENFNSMLDSKEGPETCNTYNMLKLTKMLQAHHPSEKYMHFYERALYNHILSSQHPGDKGGFVYFTPMRPRHYRVYSQAQQGFWCCVGSGMENHAKYGEFIYAYDNEDVYVNLFIPSTLSWVEEGVKITQGNDFPYVEETSLKIKLNKRSKKFGIYIRKPDWVIENGFEVKVNDEKVEAEDLNNGYVLLKRRWRSGDIINISLPMKTVVENMPDGSPWVSFVHGPIVLGAKTDTTNLKGLFADDSRMGHIANGALYPIDEAPMLVANNNNSLVKNLVPVKGKPLHYNIKNLIKNEKYKNIELQPFYTIHDARYMLYWPTTTQELYQAKKEKLRNEEANKLALELQTIDQIALGEQQPESDHGFKGEKTKAGEINNLHWRSTTAWFSYYLKNPEKNARILRVTYSNLEDNNINFEMLLNGQNLSLVKTEKNKENLNLSVIDYLVPKEISIQKQLQIKFNAKNKLSTPKVFYIRLLK